MLTPKDVAKVYDTILSIPGMNEKVKIDVKISRKNVLLLNHVIECGLAVKNDDAGTSLLSNAPEEGLQEIRTFKAELLEKAGLIELSEKLGGLASTK